MGILKPPADMPTSRSRRAPDVLSGVFGAAISGAWALTGRIRQPPPLPERQHSRLLRVVDRHIVAHDENVVALTLAAVDGNPLPRWFPGCHTDIRLPSGRVRQYSLCGDPDTRESWRIAVRRIPDGGGGSVEVHDLLHVGATVTTGGPRNAFPLSIPGARSSMGRFRFIAGGIGITPILPMLGVAAHLGVDWSMAYAGRTAASLPFLDEVTQYGNRVEVRTDDVHGRSTAEQLLGDCLDGTAVYACGPASMLTAIRSKLAGREKVELHFERFAAPPVINGEEFTFALTSFGTTVRVGAEETLLAALQRAAVQAPYSCQQGFCGTCRTRVISGRVDHRDTLLTEPERRNGDILVCVSRAPEGEHLTLEM